MRRTALAHWIASKENPLTARVIVNRVWQFHFGEGLVRTPSDFGLMGEKPTHPELLDWLAEWFVEEGWSLKKLHRLILTSNTYRMSKRCNPAYGTEDPENRLLWRFPYRRLEVEAIRDSMLAVSGRLNPKMYGPSMYPVVPEAALKGHSDPDKIWKPFDEEEASRRTIYAFIKRSLIVPMLEVLDFCDTARSSAARVNTTVAPQALTLFNGDFVNRQARHLACRLMREAGGDPGKQIDRAYRLALARPPSPGQRGSMLQFLKEESRRISQDSAGSEKPIEDNAGPAQGARAAVPGDLQPERIRLPGLAAADPSKSEGRRFEDIEEPAAFRKAAAGRKLRSAFMSATFSPLHSKSYFLPKNRREFLWEVGGGFAGLALIDLLSRDGFFAAEARGMARQPGAESACSQATALPRQGQALRLPVHERRAQPGRYVRPQAGPHASTTASPTGDP